MTALAPEVRLLNHLSANSEAKELTSPDKISKSVPQRPSSAQAVYGTAEAVPFIRNLPQLLKGQWRLHVLSKFAN